jgi:hypothetical protein
MMIKSIITRILIINTMMMMIRIIPGPIENGDDKCNDMKDSRLNCETRPFYPDGFLCSLDLI